MAGRNANLRNHQSRGASAPLITIKDLIMIKTIGYILILLGFIGLAGAAGDCDGHCMEYANDLQTFVFLSGWALVSIIWGLAMLYIDYKYNR